MLLALTEAGLPRQRAYELVQRQAMRAWREGRPLLELLRPGPGDHRPSRRGAAWPRLFDLDYHLTHVDLIFERVFGAATNRA